MLSQSTTDSYLFVIPWSLQHVGGVNQVVISLAHEMLRSGVLKPVVLIADWNAPQPIWEEMHGIQTVRWRIRPLRAQAGWKERLAFMAWRWRFQGALERFCQTHRVAAINLHYPGQGAFTFERVVRGFKRPVPLIFSFHGTDVSHLAEAPAGEKSRWQGLLGRARSVVVCSADLGKRVTEVFGSQVPWQLVYNGIDAHSFAATAQGEHPGRRRSVLSVGKFIPLKGQDVLVRAFARIAHGYPDVDLVLVGANGPALQPLRDLCAQEGVQDRVQFFVDQPHAQMAGFFQQARVFCLPSRMEAFPIVLLEAGALALPVIASRVGGIPEIIDHGVSGLLVDPDDPAALALQLRALLDAPEAAEPMGRHLRQHVMSQLTWTRACESYRSLLEN